MPIIQIHYDGWRSLPAEARKHLDVTTGSRLKVELANGALILRPAQQAKGAAAPETVVAAPAAPAEPKAVAAEIMAPRRGPGRPRKAVPQDLVPSTKVGGRRKSTLPV